MANMKQISDKSSPSVFGRLQWGIEAIALTGRENRQRQFY
jgi:hypothetical protein